jgi:hypothetical protein
MDINKVIEAGSKIQEPHFEFHFPIWGVLVGVVVCLLILIMMSISGTTGAIGGLLMIGIFIGIIAVGVQMYDTYQQKTTAYGVDIDKWKKEYVYPYINELPLEKKEIIFIKIDPELGIDILGYSHYSHIQTKERTALTISYKDDGSIITKTEWYETSMELTNEAKPYVQYQQLSKDLGHNMKAGIYNSKVYLPESYTFNGIK